MIRNIKIEDAEAIQRICNISLGYSVSVEIVMRQIQKLSEDVNHHYIYVYEDEKLQKVVGFVHAEVYESLYSYTGLNILGLAVLPEFQGKGIGRELMHHLELKAKDDSVLFIRLNSADYRVEAHKFYENIGYVCDKTQKRFIKRLD
ncbi:GNAT family N-acetyltransferase [uncultured Granulicatella sp.]|uniref:GNAT family N-acetyltransferase n=1 Tax=uncultured Granulicatella sp. TaxID=316089 RepID=UPI0028DC4D6A|nr:GNAT family N-acetyltransferase [uncultured Granulicatella sp.]